MKNILGILAAASLLATVEHPRPMSTSGRSKGKQMPRNKYKKRQARMKMQKQSRKQNWN